MEKRISQFWIDYCNGAVQLDPEFAQRDQQYFEESTNTDVNIRGKISTKYGKKYISGADTAICDIEGKQV